MIRYAFFQLSSACLERVHSTFLTSEFAPQYIIDRKGPDNLTVNDLNFPEEHGVI